MGYIGLTVGAFVLYLLLRGQLGAYAELATAAGQDGHGGKGKGSGGSELALPTLPALAPLGSIAPAAQVSGG